MPIPQIFENVHNFHLFSLHPLESATMTPNYFHFSKCPMHPLIPGFLNMLVSLSLDFFLCHSHSSCGLTKSSLSFMSQLKCSFCLQAFPDPPRLDQVLLFVLMHPVTLLSPCCHCLFTLHQPVNSTGQRRGQNCLSVNPQSLPLRLPHTRCSANAHKGKQQRKTDDDWSCLLIKARVYWPQWKLHWTCGWMALGGE